MPSELDPLLPKNKSAPEISGYGFDNNAPEAHDPEEERKWRVAEEEDLNVQSGASTLKTLLTLFMIVVGFVIFVTLLVPDGLGVSWPWEKPSKGSANIQERVSKIMTENPLIDGHNDLAILIRFLYGNEIYDEKFTKPFEEGGMKGQVDLPRLKAGKNGGAFWSAFVMCPANLTDFSDDNYIEAVAMTFSQMDLIRRLTESYPDTFSKPTANSSEQLADFKKSGKLISPIGIEGLHQIGNSYSNLRLLESLGARYVTLTHNCNNAYADAALITNSSGVTTVAPPVWGGVSPKGQELIQEMNRIGMLVDISHVSKDTMIDVLGGRPKKWKGSRAPVMFSHSSAYSLCPHPRNVPDDVLKLVKKTNSIIMVNFAPDFISCTEPNPETGVPHLYLKNSTLHQVARHITHIGELIGYDHVGIGSDFDGIPSTPDGLDDVSKFPKLIAELLRMGVSDKDAAKVVGMNILRVWKDAEKVSVEMKKEGVRPAEDHIEKPPFVI